MPFSVATSATLPRRPAVAEELRPSRDTWRWRPRHRICLPSAATAGAHPSCDRLRGSLRSGDMSLLPTANYQLPTINYSLSTTFLHFYTAIFTTARAPSLLHGHFPRRRGAGATGGTRSRASAFSSMRSLVRRPCGPVPGHQASSRCLRRAIEAASARFVAPSLAKMALTCSLTV